MMLDELQPNKLCDLLYDMAVKVGEFYSHSKVLKTEEEASRIVLLDASKKIMKQIFPLLGMNTIDRI